MFTLGEIKQKIATTNGEIDNDLFLINLLDRTFTLQAQPLYLTYPLLREGESVFILASLHHSEMVVQEECDTCLINDLFFSFLGDEWINR